VSGDSLTRNPLRAHFCEIINCNPVARPADKEIPACGNATWSLSHFGRRPASEAAV
jgi:hypothetical protein